MGLDGFSGAAAVLPDGTRTYAVGGVGPAHFADWRAAGMTGFGIGSASTNPAVGGRRSPPAPPPSPPMTPHSHDRLRLQRPPSAAGRGAALAPERAQLFWFDILGQAALLTRDRDEDRHWDFDEYVSAAGWVDATHLADRERPGLAVRHHHRARNASSPRSRPTTR
jgi:hypothetical protein